MNRTALAALAVAASLIAGACNGGAGGSPTPGPSGPPPGGSGLDGLEGRTFLSTAVQGRVLAAGTRVRLSFSAGQISASAGCNIMGGPYRVDGDHLVARIEAMTEMACVPERGDQDLWLAALLDGALIALAGNDLTLAKDGDRLTLLDRVVADPDRPLLGTLWVVDGLIAGGTVSSVPAGVLAALTFSADGVDVGTGCNEGGGSVVITATTLTFGPITLTKKACLGGVMAVERAITAVLGGEVGYAIEAGTLTLDAGAAGLILHAAP